MWTEWLARTLRPRRDEAAAPEPAPPNEDQRPAAPPERDGADEPALFAAVEE